MKKTFFYAGIILALLNFSGCVKKNAEQIEVRTVIDHAGREVEIPAKINRVVIGSILPLPSVYCMYMGSADKLVGIHPSSKAAAKNSYLGTAYPEILNVKSSFVQNGVINSEELLKLKPDVVFYVASNQEEYEIYKNAGIPAVGFAVNKSGFNPVETFADWIDLLNQIFGESNRGQEIIEYGRQIEKQISNKAASIPENKKPKVLILVNYDNSAMTAAGSSFFSEYWIGKTGGINVASELKGQKKINMETVYKWNPDILFLTNFTSFMPEDLLHNQIEGDDWSSVNAVKNGKVYKFPLGMYRWLTPTSDTPLVYEWIAGKIQPEIFDYIDMDEEIKTYYKRFYNVDLTDSQLASIYNPSSAASGK